MFSLILCFFLSICFNRCRNGRAVRLFWNIVEPDNLLNRTVGWVNSFSCCKCERLDWNGVVSAASLGVCRRRVSRPFPYYHHLIISLHLGNIINNNIFWKIFIYYKKFYYCCLNFIDVLMKQTGTWVAVFFNHHAMVRIITSHVHLLSSKWPSSLFPCTL